MLRYVCVCVCVEVCVSLGRCEGGYVSGYVMVGKCDGGYVSLMTTGGGYP